MPAFPSVTLPTDSSKLRFKEPFISEAQNRKDAGVVPPGIYRGYTPVGKTGQLLDIEVDPASGDSVAVVETLQNYNLTVRTPTKHTLDFNGHATFPVFVVIRTRYQINPIPGPLTGITESEILVVDTAVDNLDPGKLHDDDVKIARVLGIVADVPNFETVIPDDRDDTGGVPTNSSLPISSVVTSFFDPAQAIGTTQTLVTGSVTPFTTGGRGPVIVIFNCRINPNIEFGLFVIVQLDSAFNGVPRNMISANTGVSDGSGFTAIRKDGAAIVVFEDVAAGAHDIRLLAQATAGVGSIGDVQIVILHR